MLTTEQRRLAAMYQGEGLARVRGASPKVAIVGAGLAGLAAARLLDLAGCECAVFDAAAHTGGRIRTETRQGTIFELGGEFIDSAHDDMHALAEAFTLDVLDTRPASEDSLGQRLRFGGKPRSEEEVSSALVALAPQIFADVKLIGKRPGWRNSNPTAARFDYISIREYLGTLDTDEWVRRYVEANLVTLMGADAEEQSALNLLTIVAMDKHGRIEMCGEGDERYKLRDGSQRVTDALTASLESRVFLDRELVRLRRLGEGWSLAFTSHTSPTAQVHADAVILALPFSLLREVDLRGVLPPRKQQAIDELGYGRSSKLMFGTYGQPWREQGSDGRVLTDTALQSSWDCSRLRGDNGGVFTLFLGGSEADALAAGTDASQATRFLPLIENVFPGLSKRWTGAINRIHWPGERWAKAGYAAYRPGQWTAFGGVEAEPVAENLFFAGEHCSRDFQGYMNGAAETGRSAALAILARL